MSFLNGIGLNSLVGQMAISNELQNLREIQLNMPTLNSYGLTMSGKAQIAQTEVQNEDNTTFLFEYRAYLNSQLTTIVTKLTNAMTSDLDVAMTRKTNKYGNKNNMQGETTDKNIDPGAGRVAVDYLSSWRALGGVTVRQPTSPSPSPVSYGTYGPPGTREDQGPWSMTSTGPPGWGLLINDGTLTSEGNTNTADGTFAVITYGNNPIGQSQPNDTLWVNYKDLSTNYYNQGGAAGGGGVGKQETFNVTDPAAQAARAGNKFEEVLFRESRTSVFRSILKADLMKDLVISASSSLSTGSQVQASVSLNARFSAQTYAAIPNNYGAAVDVFLNRFTSFYHT